MTVVYLFALLVGIGAWLPAPDAQRREWIGFLFFQSIMFLIVLLYVGNVLFGIGLSRLLPVIAVLAASGLIYRAYLARPSLSDAFERFRHPVWALTLLAGVVILANGGIEYLPMPGDETASWLRHARQIFLVDAYWSDEVVYHLGSYTNAWPMLIAFTNTMHGVYDDAHGVAIGLIMQIGMLGATYDIVRYIARQEELSIDRNAEALLGWLFILLLLAGEASWVLLPTFQLIDEPLIFAFLGCFLTALAGLYAAADRRLFAFYLGMAIAGTFLLKVTAMAFLPVAAIVFIAYLHFDKLSVARDGQSVQLPSFGYRASSYAVLIFTPFMFANATWQFFKIGADCTASPILLLTSGSGPAFQQPLFVARGFVFALADFVTAYKVPLSIFGVIAFAIGIFHRRAVWLIVGFGGMSAMYIVALYFGYLTCFDVFQYGKFEALPRYMRTPLRLLHFLGPIVLMMCALRLADVRRSFSSLTARRSIRLSAAIAAGLLLAWQVRSVDRSLHDMRTRDYQDPLLRAMILRTKSEAASLRTVIAAQNLNVPRVSFVAQGTYGAEYDLAMYFGIRSLHDGPTNFAYVPAPPFFWGSEKTNIFTAVSNADALRSHWQTFDIIWPYLTDDFTRSVLKTLATNPDCAANPEKFFLIRTSTLSFDCVAKM